MSGNFNSIFSLKTTGFAALATLIRQPKDCIFSIREAFNCEFANYSIISGFLVDQDGNYITQQDGKKIRFTL